MAHSCPICDSYCHCGGDIDDIQLDGTEHQNSCNHCDDLDDEDWDNLNDLFEDDSEETELPTEQIS